MALLPQMTMTRKIIKTITVIRAIIRIKIKKRIRMMVILNQRSPQRQEGVSHSHSIYSTLAKYRFEFRIFFYLKAYAYTLVGHSPDCFKEKP